MICAVKTNIRYKVTNLCGFSGYRWVSVGEVGLSGFTKNDFEILKPNFK